MAKNFLGSNATLIALSALTAQSCMGECQPVMDPSRKRAIRLTVALTAALLLATALIYTSFSAGREELTASQLLQKARPGQS